MRLILSVIGIAFAIGLNGGCGGEDAASTTEMRFTVVDSLLGPVFVVPQTGTQVNPPRGFAPVPDSIFSRLQGHLHAGLGSEAGLEMVGCFLDSSRPAGLVVSVIDTLNLSIDTGRYFHGYGRSLRDSFRECEVREGEYRVHDIFIKNYLLTDSVNIRFQLLCLTDRGNALELMYFAPRSAYSHFIRYFESSIGSLQLINQGGRP